MSDKPSPGDGRGEGASADGGRGDAEQAFPKAKSIENGAVLGLAIGTLAVTATFGLRTAVFLPDYSAEGNEMAALAIHGAAEMVAALLIGFFVVWLRNGGLAKTLLVIVAVIVGFAKMLVLAFYVAVAEPPDALISPGTMLLCAWVTVPLWLSFFPVLSAIHAARRSRAIDAPIGVRAAVGAWLLGAGFTALVLGPDILVRAWSLIALGAAAGHAAIGAAEERRLHAWVRGAVTQGAPVYEVQEGAVPDEIPSVYEGDARLAVISAAHQDSASYRRDPARRPVAAIDPKGSLAPRSFQGRATRRAAVSLLVAVLAGALCWPFLHGSDLPPRKLAWQYNHWKISRYEEHEIPGVSLWTVQMDSRTNLVVGFDEEKNEVVEKEALFRRARGLSIPSLAKLANGVLYNGYCCVLTGMDMNGLMAEQGEKPKEPHVLGGKLVFWRRLDGKLDRFEVEVEGWMYSDKPEKDGPR